jgi:hypothetical protein
MSVKVRPYRRGGWEVDVRVRLPSGTERASGSGRRPRRDRRRFAGAKHANGNYSSMVRHNSERRVPHSATSGCGSLMATRERIARSQAGSRPRRRSGRCT